MDYLSHFEFYLLHYLYVLGNAVNFLQRKNTPVLSFLCAKRFISFSIKINQPCLSMATLAQMAVAGPFRRKISPNKPMEGKPFMKAIVLKPVIRKPKKPNSANRKCVRIRLSSGREVVAYIPGEGHNLQEHNIVLVRGGRTQDLVGVKHKVVRGVFDCAAVQRPQNKT